MTKKEQVVIIMDINQFKNHVSNQNFSNLMDIACEYAIDQGDIYKNEFVSEFEITDFGNIIKGEAYDHEAQKHYNIIGVELKIRRKYKFGSDVFERYVWGLYPIYLSEHYISAPVTFQESCSETYGSNSYSNGCGDEVQVVEVVVDRANMERFLKDYDFQAYNKK